MRDFIHHFFGQSDTTEFTLFSFAHLAPILVAAALIYVIYRFRKPLQGFQYEYVFRYILAFMLIISEM